MLVQIFSLDPSQLADYQPSWEGYIINQQNYGFQLSKA